MVDLGLGQAAQGVRRDFHRTRGKQTWTVECAHGPSLARNWCNKDKKTRGQKAEGKKQKGLQERASGSFCWLMK
ncbi:hypothetical protein DC3_49870 [Deinococcus cellulosilyticus NBRC 106333 = KACC 11606]|uniref:Uncharacterized protein n=1 Tax=Deinococcus cellulosilyticus (strain DSM 18568 / NBRC 106333 / KACC 11606 / 5516J-15) TaxID=1223518 RepID=A0A511N943_DEIC1|nr:hypothetical protein DC3_49870 [Deinococcus cellulosilyticus NBRC 106333 = KACC 11606]